MRDYGKVHTSFWSSATIRSMSEDGRSLALYLLTSPHTTISGTFRLPDGYVCEDLQWTSERVSEGFAELFQKGFANRCETTKWVWIRKHLEWNPPENPNQRKSAQKIVMSVPQECAWINDFIGEFGELLGIPRERFLNPSETVSQPVTVTVTEEKALSGKPDPDPPPKPEKPDYSPQSREVLEYLNQIAGKAYRPVRANLDLITARLKEGFTVDDLCAVVQRKAEEWQGKPDMEAYLRPETLFNARKFAQYSGQLSQSSAIKVDL